MAQQISFFISSAAVCLAAAISARIFMADREPWRRLLAAVSAVPVFVLALVLLLGILGNLSTIPMVVAASIIAAVLALAEWRAGKTPKRSTEGAKLVPSHDKVAIGQSRGATWYLAVGILGGVWGSFTVESLFGGVDFSTDDLIYHASAVGHWIQDGRLSFAPQGFQAYYPKNAEVFSLWFVLPFHGDGLANLAGWYWSTLGVVAAVALCRIAGCSAATAMLAGALFIASPLVLRQALTFSAVDVAGASAMLAGLALALPSRSSTPKERLIDALYSGLLLGLAIGIKVSLAPVGLILAAAFASAYGTQGSGKMRIPAVLVFIGSAVTTGGYWYLQNILLTGNPIFPAEFGPFAGPFGRADQYRTTLLRGILAAGGDLEQWKIVARAYLTSHVGLGLVAFAGYSMALYKWCRSRLFGTAEPDARTNLILLVGMTLLVLYLLMPFSGTIDGPNASFRASPRYIIGPFAIGLVLFTSLAGTSSGLKKIVIPVVVLAIVQSWIREFPDNSWIVVLRCTLGVGVAVVLYLVARLNLIARLTRQIRVRYMAAGSVLTVLAVITAYAPYKQTLTDDNMHNFTRARDNPFAGSAWKLLGTIPEGARVAAFGPRMWMYYPLFGRHFQLVPRPGDTNAAAYVQYHLRNSLATKWWWHEDTKEFNSREFRMNLKSRGVQYVLTTRGQNPEWPIQHHALAKSDAAELIYDDDRSALWRLHGDN